MKDLLNNGFQPVSETEMVMVEGGRSSCSDRHTVHGLGADDTGQISAGWKKIRYRDLFVDDHESGREDQYTKIVSGIMQAERMSGCGSGCGAPCFVKSLNDHF